MSSPTDDRVQPHQPGISPAGSESLSPLPDLDDYHVPDSILLPAATSRLLREHTRCPWCNRSLETSLAGGHTSLGPSLLQCPGCERVMRSHRREWCDRGTPGKAWYAFLSLVYVQIAASMGAVFTLFWCLVFGAPESWPPIAAAVFWGAFAAVLQILRVVKSIERTRSIDREPVRYTFWALDNSWQQKLLVGIVLSSIPWAAVARLLAN